MNVWDEIKHDANGLAILKEWLGEGATRVRQEVADHRSLSCVAGNDGNPCPHNKEPNWYERNIKQPVAQAIKRTVEIKARLALATPLEDKLFMCSRCGCFLPLKVHTPISHIKSHMTPDQISNLPAYCWMRKEIEHAKF